MPASAPERIEGSTPAGGAYAIAYRGDDGSIEIVEFDGAGVGLNALTVNPGRPAMSNQQQLDDLMDTRGEIRRLRKAVDSTRAAAAEGADRARSGPWRSEDILVQIDTSRGGLRSMRMPRNPRRASCGSVPDNRQR